MNRLLLLLIFTLVLGCSKSAPNPPANATNPPTGDAASQSVETGAVAPAGGTSNSAQTSTFDPTTSTPHGSATANPQFPEKTTAQPTLELTPEVKEAVANLVHADTKVKDQAQTTVEALNEKTLDTLLAAANDTSDDVRAGAMYGLLGRFNQYDDRILTTVLAGLGDANSRVRGFALVAASDAPPEKLLSGISHLSAMLRNTSEPPHVRAAAARLIARLGRDQRGAAFAALQQGLFDDSDRSVRLACLNGLVETAPSPADATFALTKALDSPNDAPLRRAAAMRLGELGAAAESAVPALITALGDSDDRVAKTAAAALTHIGGSAVPALAVATETGEKHARLLAIGALYQLGSVASSSQSQLKKAAQDSDAEIQAAATAALQAIGR